MELLLFLVSVVDVPLQMSLCAEALATVGVRALVIFAMVSLMVSVYVSFAKLECRTMKTRCLLKLVWLIKYL